jgi:predicted NAD/FAD-binding protein
MSDRVAIIGGGVAGLTAGHLLHGRYPVTVFEKEERLGGNAYSYRAQSGDEVDIAVAAFGRAGYRHFYELLARLGVRTRASMGSFMSFHDLDRRDGLYITPSLRGLLAQRFRVLHPLRVLKRVAGGLGAGRRVARAGGFAQESVAEALEALPDVEGEARTVLLCVFCLLSSMSAEEVLRAPAAFFFRKLDVHHDIVSWKAATSVRTVDGGTRRYVEALAAGYPIVRGARIRSVARDDRGVRIRFAGGGEQAFEQVVFACNADQALALLESPTPLERELLGAWRYKEGRVVVHRDHSSFPPRPLMQAYTFLYTLRDGFLETSVNGSLWREPGVSKRCDLVSSQHPNFPVRPDLVELDTVLRTPVFDFGACATQPRLPELNGIRRTYYCGSYFGYGLHEDAVRSAADVARRLGVELWR